MKICRGDVNKLTNFTPEYRLRVGDYLILFEVEQQTIVIYRVRHRKESYSYKGDHAMLALHPEFLAKEGQKVFAVLPYEEFCRIQDALADFEDLVALRQAKAEEATPPDLFVGAGENLARHLYCP